MLVSPIHIPSSRGTHLSRDTHRKLMAPHLMVSQEVTVTPLLLLLLEDMVVTPLLLLMATLLLLMAPHTLSLHTRLWECQPLATLPYPHSASRMIMIMIAIRQERHIKS